MDNDVYSDRTNKHETDRQVDRQTYWDKKISNRRDVKTINLLSTSQRIIICFSNTECNRTERAERGRNRESAAKVANTRVENVNSLVPSHQDLFLLETQR